MTTSTTDNIYTSEILQYATQVALKATRELRQDGVSDNLMGLLLSWSINDFMPDTITYNEDLNIFNGSVYVIDVRSQSVRNVSFNIPKKKSLEPFIYNKPKVTQWWDPYDKNAISTEDTNRGIWGDGIDYYPVCFTPEDIDPIRGPNHLHESWPALICAVCVNDVWQTRYFPEKNISSEAWQEAQDIIAQSVA